LYLSQRIADMKPKINHINSNIIYFMMNHGYKNTIDNEKKARIDIQTKDSLTSP